MIDWSLAERIGRAVAGEGEVTEWSGRMSVPESARRAGEALVELTGLEPAGEIPTAEPIGRSEWLQVNLRGLRDSLGPTEARIERELELPGPLGGLARGFVGGAIGAEAGAILGYAAGRVLGQYEIALVGPPRPPRLLFVAPNISGAARELGPEQALLDWIALHEVTHALQFGATPWLREHLGGLVERLLSGVQPRSTATRLLGAGRAALSSDPRKVLGELREAGPVGAFLGPDQAEILGQILSGSSLL